MIFLIIFGLFVVTQAQYEGEVCNNQGRNGICVNLRNCQSAIDEIKQRQRPKICTFVGQDPIVCCFDSRLTTTARPVATTSTRRTTTTTEYVPPEYDYKFNDGTSSSGCSQLDPKITSRKIGKKAWDKCIEYQEKYLYPCVRGVSLAGDMTRANYCGHGGDELIVGGTNASREEFPHMALLGFGELETIQWLCAGTIISEKYILTAGHCIGFRDLKVSYAAIGVWTRANINPSNIYKISQIIKHPDYQPPVKYNDLALLKTERTMQLDRYAVPACLYVPVPDSGILEKAIATGWGTVSYGGSIADILQKVTLTKFETRECAQKFPPARLLKQGFNENTQICYGDKQKSKDTCQGDSGGPLQIKNKLISCMYTIIGVTSFGKACGFVGEPGIYTRVEQFVPWIESVVWP